MAIVSQTKFAEMTGRSRQAISQRTKRGTLVALASGKMDTEDPVNAQLLFEISEEKKAKIKSTSSANSGGTQSDASLKNDAFAKKVSEAKRGQEVLKYKKLELEIKEMQGELVRRDSLGNACFGYLSALNINMMEMPQSFLDQLESAIVNKASRSEKMEIVTKPICDAIDQTLSQIERILKSKDEK